MNEETKSVCSECVAEDGLRDFLEHRGTRAECSYCGNLNVLVVPASEVIDLIVECLPRHYEDPAESVGYDSAEGGYLLPTMDSRELLEDAGLSMADPDFITEAADALDQVSSIWVETDPYSSRYDERLMYDWADFSSQVKHVTRYTFLKTKVEHMESGDTAVDQPYQVMGHICGVIDRLEAYRTVKRGEAIFRARKHVPSEVIKEGKDIGPAPRDKAQQNRMSPAGISAFYGAFDSTTASLEARGKSEHDSVTVGLFEANSELNLIDFSRIDLSGTMFVLEPKIDHEEVRFLKAFRHEISKPIELDDRIHIEYVPTQVLTEYLRYCFKPSGFTIHGIVYPSCISKEGENVVLFCDDSLGVPKYSDKPSEPWLVFKCFVRPDFRPPKYPDHQQELL